MTKRALIACAHHWRSPVQVGDHHIARQLVARGYEVAFVSNPVSPWHVVRRTETVRDRFRNFRAGGERDLDGRLWSYVPGALVVPRRGAGLDGRWVMRHWPLLTLPGLVARARREGFGRVDLLVIREARQSFWIDHLEHDRLVYRVADRDAGFATHTPAVRAEEERLARAADLVVHSAAELASDVAELGARRTFHLPNGVDFAHFADGDPAPPPEYWDLDGPVAVFAGSIEEWVDLDLVALLAGRMPEFTFVLIGPAPPRARALERVTNIRVLGARPFEDLPAYLRHATVGIIPFDRERHGDLVDAVQPLKLHEYLASDLPVVATRWPEIERMASPARLATDPEEWERALRAAAQDPAHDPARAVYARAHDWSGRVDTLLGALAAIPPRTRSGDGERALEIAIDGRFLAQPLTGVQRYGRELLHEFDRIATERRARARLLVPEGCAVPRLHAIGVERIGGRGGHLWEQFELPRAVGDAVLFCPAGSAPLGRLRRGEPTVVTVHGLSFIHEPGSYSRAFRRLYRWMTGTIAARATRVIAVSESEAERLRDRFPAVTNRLAVIENGTVPHAFASVPPPANAPGRHTVLFVGTPTESKRAQCAIDAFRRVADDHPELTLELVGASARAYRAVPLVVPDDLRARVRFVGRVDSPEELVAHYRRARVLLFPSRYESSGLPPTEALALGCPVVASDLPVLRDRLGDAAFFFPVDDFEACVARLRTALTDDAAVAGALERAQPVLERESWRRCAERTWAALEVVALRTGAGSTPVPDPVPDSPDTERETRVDSAPGTHEGPAAGIPGGVIAEGRGTDRG